MRVDILERLADLIRPALAWREGAPGESRRARSPGGGFTVVNTMTSLTGASGEDFASILRSLGYRMEQRPKPPKPAATPLTQHLTVSGEATAARRADAVGGGQRDANAAADCGRRCTRVRVPAGSGQPAVAERPTLRSRRGHAEAEPSNADAVAGAARATLQRATPKTATVASPRPNPVRLKPSTQRPDGDAATAEPELIEVWRPGRAEGAAAAAVSAARCAQARRRGRPQQTGSVAAHRPPRALRRHRQRHPRNRRQPPRQRQRRQPAATSAPPAPSSAR